MPCIYLLNLAILQEGQGLSHMFKSLSSLYSAVVTMPGIAIALFQLTHIDRRVHKLSDLSSPAPQLNLRSSSSYLSVFSWEMGWLTPLEYSQVGAQPFSSLKSMVSLKKEHLFSCHGPATTLPPRPAPQYLSHCLCTCSILLAFSAFPVTCWNENVRSLGLCSPFPYINLSHTRCGSLLLRKTNWFH